MPWIKGNWPADVGVYWYPNLTGIALLLTRMIQNIYIYIFFNQSMRFCRILLIKVNWPADVGVYWYPNLTGIALLLTHD